MRVISVDPPRFELTREEAERLKDAVAYEVKWKQGSYWIWREFSDVLRQALGR